MTEAANYRRVSVALTSGTQAWSTGRLEGHPHGAVNLFPC